jgi:uncharacterized protein YdaU (DUF1376 family)
MSQAPAMPLFCDAYLGDTTHLSLEEHGAYLKLLMVTWRNNGIPLPDDDVRIARILGVSVRRWRTRLRPVIAPFFDLSESTFRQKRLDKVWNFVAKRSAICRINGERGGRPKSMINKDSENPAGLPNETQKESIRIRIQEREESPEMTNVISSPLGNDDRKPAKRITHAEKRGSRLSPDWEPDETNRKFAEQWGHDPDELLAEFRDYWLGEPGAHAIKLDWSRTWRNRCRQRRGAPANGCYRTSAATNGSSPTGVISAARRVIEQMRLANGGSVAHR